MASSLDISQNDLLTPIIPIEESGVKNPIFEESVLKIENEPIENWTFIKIINLSSLPLCWFPVANFLPPLLIMLISNKSFRFKSF
ncbi:hypothetical protein [Epilithonimonas sp.]|uniref:hypothetical protein n=1 Tax=Epilithonimonas sp. TaxID=2894511 RepID=UPI002FDD0910